MASTRILKARTPPADAPMSCVAISPPGGQGIRMQSKRGYGRAPRRAGQLTAKDRAES